MSFNAIIGRVCGRISDSKFELNGKEYSLFANNGKNHLHGGQTGFSRRMWTVHPTEEGAKLKYTSEHLEEGYPGELSVEVEYSLLKEVAGYKTEMIVTTDRDTIVNLNTHEYFNLSGGRAPNAYDSHKLMIPFEHFLEMTKEVIPSGKILSVKDHPAFDFTCPKQINQNRGKPDPHWDFMEGFDHSFLVEQPIQTQSPADKSEKKDQSPTQLPLAAILSCELSGIELEIRTNQKVVHFYGGEFLDPDLGGFQLKGKSGEIYQKNAGICFECQGYPNAPNQHKFPSVELKPGQVYRNVTTRSFRKLVPSASDSVN